MNLPPCHSDHTRGLRIHLESRANNAMCNHLISRNTRFGQNIRLSKASPIFSIHHTCMLIFWSRAVIDSRPRTRNRGRHSNIHSMCMEHASIPGNGQMRRKARSGCLHMPEELWLIGTTLVFTSMKRDRKSGVIDLGKEY